VPFDLVLVAITLVVAVFLVVVWQERYEDRHGAKWRRIVLVAILALLLGGLLFYRSNR
jgi:hypothetical protein